MIRYVIKTNSSGQQIITYVSHINTYIPTTAGSAWAPRFPAVYQPDSELTPTMAELPTITQ